MAKAYIFCPDVIIDAFDKKSKDHDWTITLLSALNQERFAVTCESSKRYKGFVSDYHKSQIIDIATDLLLKDEIGKDEIYILHLVLSSLDEEGIEYKSYKDEYLPIFDLAEQIEDSYEIFIVYNNGKAHSIEEQNGFGDKIITAKEALTDIISSN